MFSLAIVSLVIGLYKNYSADLHKVQWKRGTWAIENTIRF